MLRGRDPYRTVCAKHYRFKPDEGMCAGREEFVRSVVFRYS